MHSFDVDVACKVGINAAIVFQNIGHICEYHKTNESHFHDGRYWMFNTRKAFMAQYSYLTEKQVRLAVERLVEAGLVMKGNFNEKNFDRTTWYALTDEGQRIFRVGPIREPQRANTSAPEGQAIPLYTNVINTPLGVDDEEEERAREYNPFGDGDIPAPKIDTVQKYAMQQLTVMGVRAMEEMNSFVEDLSEDIVRHAIDNALDNGKRTWAYVRAILNGYVDAGVRSVGEAEEQDAKHRQRASVTETPPPPKPPKPKLSRRMVVRLLDYLHMEQMGVLYEDGEIKARGKFYYGRVNGDDLYIEGDETTKRWEDAKCDRGKQLSDFFP